MSRLPSWLYMLLLIATGFFAIALASTLTSLGVNVIPAITIAFCIYLVTFMALWSSLWE